MKKSIKYTLAAIVSVILSVNGVAGFNKILSADNYSAKADNENITNKQFLVVNNSEKGDEAKSSSVNQVVNENTALEKLVSENAIVNQASVKDEGRTNENTSSSSVKKADSTASKGETRTEVKQEVKTEVRNDKPTTPYMNDGNKNSGSVKVAYYNDTDRKMKLGITKDGSTKYFSFNGKGEEESFPLQSGSGEYTINLYLNESGTSYKCIKTWNITVSIKDSNSVYLASSNLVNWESSSSAKSIARELTSNLSSNEAKAKAIYNYVLNNIRYDMNKANSVGSSYVPSLNGVLSSKSGICYDFASLYTGMLRSVGIPAKLIMGTSANASGYHAWSEVYINGSWMTVDTSYDSQAKAAHASYSMYKSSSSYSKEKEY